MVLFSAEWGPAPIYFFCSLLEEDMGSGVQLPFDEKKVTIQRTPLIITWIQISLFFCIRQNNTQTSRIKRLYRGDAIIHPSSSFLAKLGVINRTPSTTIDPPVI